VWSDVEVDAPHVLLEIALASEGRGALGARKGARRLLRGLDAVDLVERADPFVKPGGVVRRRLRRVVELQRVNVVVRRRAALCSLTVSWNVDSASGLVAFNGRVMREERNTSPARKEPRLAGRLGIANAQAPDRGVGVERRSGGRKRMDGRPVPSRMVALRRGRAAWRWRGAALRWRRAALLQRTGHFGSRRFAHGSSDCREACEDVQVRVMIHASPDVRYAEVP